MRKNDLHQRNTWTVQMAAEWADVPVRTLYELLKRGVVPAIKIGTPQQQAWPSAHDGKRKRACYRYLIPRVAFMQAWETIGTGKTAA